MKKIASFTILELMIALLISAVIISISFGALSIIKTQFDRYQSRTSSIRTFRLLNVAIQRDFDRADRIVDTLADSSHLVLICNDTLISYDFRPANCIRAVAIPDGSPLTVDTFAMGASAINIFFLNDSMPLITGVVIQVKVNGAAVPIIADKTYSAQEIMAWGGYPK